jgi:hypothetical protein
MDEAMANDMRNRSLAPSDAQVRPDYSAGTYLSAKDLNQEQKHRLSRLRHHNRYLHGTGIVCGLQVVPADDPRRPWAVQVCPGYAIDCCGDEVMVPERTVVDIRDHLWRNPRHKRSRVAYVTVQYTQALVRPLAVGPSGCGCDEPPIVPSRIRDGFQVGVLWDLPEAGRDGAFDLCSGDPVPCPDCPDNRTVILACVTLPASEGDPIRMQHIDNRSCQR